MEPTLLDRNWVAVTTLGFYAQRGDIVVISQPNALNEPLIKRIIAVAGDTVEIDPQAHTVAVNGENLDEPYISEPVEKAGDLTYPVQVPEGYVFVMGDNRNDSLDSRSSTIGFIDTRYLSGKAVFRYRRKSPPRRAAGGAAGAEEKADVARSQKAGIRCV